MFEKTVLSHFQTRPLANPAAPAQLPFSTDLNRTQNTVHRTDSGWLLPDGQTLTPEQVDQINNSENSCFLFENSTLRKVETFSEHTQRYYSLMPTAAAPTLLISGIPMHRIKGTTPDVDTQMKIKALGKPYGKVLDTATGLGYTAILAAQTAAQVITVELDPAVIRLCRMNPWSQGLFTNRRIVQVIGDSADLAAFLPEASVNAIVHDPPMFNLAGHLYSSAIYADFYRILTPKGRLFHYIGNPESRSGASVGRGVVNRLQSAGFSVSPQPKAFGVLAKK